MVAPLEVEKRADGTVDVAIPSSDKGEEEEEEEERTVG